VPEQSVRRVRINPYWKAFISYVVVLTVFGCNYVPAEKFQATQRQLQLTQEKVNGLEVTVADQQQTISKLQSRIMEMRQLDEGDLEQLITPVRIEIEKLSGGYNEDGKPGDEGIELFVRPIDRDQHVIKAAGTLQVTLYDLANPPESQVIGECLFDAAQTRSLWYGRMWTHHFTVRCPWINSRYPVHDEITARVVFTDLLTGKSLTAQEVFHIDLPAK